MRKTVGSSIGIYLSCGNCGADKVPIPDKAADDTPIVCPACDGQLATWGTAKSIVIEKATEEGLKAIKDKIKDTFSGDNRPQVD